MAEKEDIKQEIEENDQLKEEGNLQEKQTELDDLNDRYKRIMAEFENYKKRSQKEKENLYNSVLGDIIIGMLPIMDNLDGAASAECKDEKYKQGVELVQKQFKEFLQKNKVEEIKTEGEIFDPSLHEAISMVQNPEKESQEIVQEYRKGYKLGNKVIRHSMVVVNN